MNRLIIIQWIEDDYHCLFDLAKDPRETTNVMKQNPEVIRDLLRVYFDFRNKIPAYRNPFIRPIDNRSL